MSLIHSTAIISENAIIGRNVTIGPFSIVHENVEIGENTVIGSHCELGISNHLSDGERLIISKDSFIRSHSIFYEGSRFGEKLITGHRVTVREKTITGKNFQIGTLSDIQGHCEIGDYVRFHSNVHIGQKSKIGSFVWIFPYVVLTNDPHPPSDVLVGARIDDFAAIGTMSVLLPGAHVARGVLLAAHSSLKGVTEEDYLYVGSPAKKICPLRVIRSEHGKQIYPWRKFFHRGYPDEIIQKWIEEFKQ